MNKNQDAEVISLTINKCGQPNIYSLLKCNKYLSKCLL